jgi:tetratricopeptide (TPR) repeat protein
MTSAPWGWANPLPNTDPRPARACGLHGRVRRGAQRPARRSPQAGLRPAPRCGLHALRHRLRHRWGHRWGHRLRQGLGALAAALLLAVRPGAAGTARAAPPAPFAAAVLPCEDLRHPGGSSWLGAYLQERIAKALLRAPQVAVLEPESAAYWQRTLGLHAGSALPAQAYRRMGVSVLLQCTTQEVLGLAEVQLSARTEQEELLEGAAGRLRISLGTEPPAVALPRVLGAVQRALVPGTALSEPHLPADWAAVEQLYTLLGRRVPLGGRPAQVAQLQPWTAHPALGGRAHEALAGLLLEQALLDEPEGAGRQRLLAMALQHAAAALQADPLDTRRQALKGELHYFLRQDYEAKTEASVARIRNPLEPLAFVVLGLVAGLSTGEANESLRRALALDPSLRAAGRRETDVAFQGGALEPLFLRWDHLRGNTGMGRSDDYAERLAEAIEHYDRREYAAAEPIFRALAQREDNDYTPWLYLNRILIEIGHPEQAVPGLRRLAAGNPEEADILYSLGVALAASGETQAAQESFRKALAERPDDVPSLYGLATTEMTLEHWPQALADLRAVLHADPEHGDAWLRLGVVQERLGDLPAAEGALLRAVELRPDSEEARKHLAAVRERLAAAPQGPRGATQQVPQGEPQGAAHGAPAAGGAAPSPATPGGRASAPPAATGQ